MIIYKITNTINGKIYIGLTKRTLKIRKQRHYQDHKIEEYPLYRAMRKYGFNNFTFEVIDNSNDINDLGEKEKYWIREYDCLTPKGYNILKGGLNPPNFYENKTPKKIAKSKEEASILHHNRTNKRTNKYCGVWKASNRWYFQIKKNRVQYSNSCETEIDAAESYDRLAVYFYGTNANLNFPEKRDLYLLTNWDDFLIKVKHKKVIRGIRKPNFKLCACGKRITLVSKNCSKCNGEKRKGIKLEPYNLKRCPLSRESLHWLIWNESKKNICKNLDVSNGLLTRWLKESQISYPKQDNFWQWKWKGKMVDYQI